MLTLIQDAFERFMAEENDEPITMLNLLRFRPDGGRERYNTYLEELAPILARLGAKVVYFGEGLPALAAEEGQAWDAVLLVRYPNRQGFVGLAQDPDYRDRVGPLRESSLLEAVLQPLRTIS